MKERQIRLTADLREKLEQEAHRRGHTITDLILFVLWRYFRLPNVQE